MRMLYPSSKDGLRWARIDGDLWVPLADLVGTYTEVPKEHVPCRFGKMVRVAFETIVIRFHRMVMVRVADAQDVLVHLGFGAVPFWPPTWEDDTGEDTVLEPEILERRHPSDPYQRNPVPVPTMPPPPAARQDGELEAAVGLLKEVADRLGLQVEVRILIGGAK